MKWQIWSEITSLGYKVSSAKVLRFFFLRFGRMIGIILKVPGNLIHETLLKQVPFLWGKQWRNCVCDLNRQRGTPTQSFCNNLFSNLSYYKMMMNLLYRMNTDKDAQISMPKLSHGWFSAWFWCDTEFCVFVWVWCLHMILVSQSLSCVNLTTKQGPEHR